MEISKENYPKEFVERTLSMFTSLSAPAYASDREVTLLMNCLLGLLVIVHEKLSSDQKGSNSFNIRLDDPEIAHIIPPKIVFVRQKEKELREKETDSFNKLDLLAQYGKTVARLPPIKIGIAPVQYIASQKLSWLVQKVRNGIAHQNIKPTSEDKNWTGVEIWNYNSDGRKDFAVHFEIPMLKNFAQEVASRYLDVLDEEQQKQNKA